MYLAPYIACVGVFAVALLAAVRAKSTTDGNTVGGIIARAVLTFLLFAFVGTLWYYTSEHFLENKTIELWVRIITAVAYLCYLPEIWIDAEKGK